MMQVQDSVTISPKFQVVIPRVVREAMGLEPGTKVMVFQYEGRIELIPAQAPSTMKGFLKGMNTTIEKEPDRL